MEDITLSHATIIFQHGTVIDDNDLKITLFVSGKDSERIYINQVFLIDAIEGRKKGEVWMNWVIRTNERDMLNKLYNKRIRPDITDAVRRVLDSDEYSLLNKPKSCITNS